MMKTVFFAFIPIHLRQELVEHAVRGAPGVSLTAPALVGDRVELVEEEHAGRALPRLVEDLPHVGLGLPEPHGEQLGALHGDEVRLALVRDGLRQERLTAPGGAVEEDTLARGHPELLKLVGVLDRVLHHLLQLALDVLQAADVVPGCGGYLHERLAEGGGVGDAEGRLEVVVRDTWSSGPRRRWCRPQGRSRPSSPGCTAARPLCRGRRGRPPRSRGCWRRRARGPPPRRASCSSYGSGGPPGGPPRPARRCRSHGRSGRSGAARGRSSWGVGRAHYHHVRARL